MFADTVVKPHYNAVVYQFTWYGTFASVGLNAFAKITVTIDGESYNTVDDPDEVYVEGTERLVLVIGAVTSIPDGQYDPEIVGQYADGKTEVLTCAEFQTVNPTNVAAC